MYLVIRPIPSSIFSIYFLAFSMSSWSLGRLLFFVHVVAALGFVYPILSNRRHCAIAAESTTMASSFVKSPRARTLPPGKLIVGYCNWNQCGDESIVRAVQDGVNVIIWFAINLATDPSTGLPAITNGPDWTCVANTVEKINALGLPTTHLIRCADPSRAFSLLIINALLHQESSHLVTTPNSVGGWNSPHPDTSIPPDAYFAHWHKWNTEVVANPAKGASFVQCASWIATMRFFLPTLVPPRFTLITDNNTSHQASSYQQ